jgi:hypothetical protein
VKKKNAFSCGDCQSALDWNRLIVRKKDGDHVINIPDAASDLCHKIG